MLAISLSDPFERELPPPGRYRLVAGDAAELAIDTHLAAARRDYAHAYSARVQDFVAFCQRYGIHHLLMSTDDDPVSSLQTALGRRTH